MNAKLLFPARLTQPSGTSLLILLAFITVFWAGVIDLSTGGFEGKTALMSIPLLTCASICGILGYGTVPLLRRLKTGQVIQEDGPQTHLKKAGTPTMGGIFFIPVAVIVALIWSQPTPELIAVSLVTLAYAAIGWIDDWQVLRQQSNKGISPRMKLTLQITVAVLFCFWMIWHEPASITNIALPGGINLSLGLLFWPLAGFVLTAENNATNLTDGVDGLAAGTGAIAFVGLGAIAASTSPELMIFCACLSGGCLGFTLHNRNPATVFMGDTGSLAVGGALAAVGLLSGNLWALFIVSGIFFVESLSVIAQVSYYKATKGRDGKGKRLFKMAPLHHHLELSGWSETQIVGAFYLINTLLAVIAYLFR
ncbi:phospho-N-acetylmuramoyl-pentapeptide-transferase [Pleurocapsales cyanobacterium LEGE 06147]|nr:phospho-N-acetylmuramoyl-pentapeptide-transferase [Pleurocapsales cyanobacterium LEGE 06147]